MKRREQVKVPAEKLTREERIERKVRELALIEEIARKAGEESLAKMKRKIEENG